MSGIQSPQNIRGVPLEDSTQYDPDTKEGGLFTSYINTFLKYKLEASGPSDWIKTPKDTKEYINPYFEKEGVSLDSEKIKTSCPKGNDRSPEKKQVFLNSSLVIKRLFSIGRGQPTLQSMVDQILNSIKGCNSVASLQKRRFTIPT